MQIIVDGLLTNYQRAGNGKTVLLLHGWGDSMASYKSLFADLSGTYDVLALDLPGFGSSQAPNSVWNLDNYANFIKSFQAKLAIKNVYAIVGHSNGGALAIRGLSIGSLKADKLILLASSGVRNQQGARRQIIKVIAKTGKVLTVWLPAKYRQKLRTKLYGVAGSDMLAAPELQETFKQTVRQDVQEDASKLALPTLLIYGSDDKATPVSYGQAIAARIKNSRLEVVPSAGHFVHHDQAGIVMAKIKEFLA